MADRDLIPGDVVAFYFSVNANYNTLLTVGRQSSEVDGEETVVCHSIAVSFKLVRHSLTLVRLSFGGCVPP